MPPEDEPVASQSVRKKEVAAVEIGARRTLQGWTTGTALSTSRAMPTGCAETTISWSPAATGTPALDRKRLDAASGSARRTMA